MSLIKCPECGKVFSDRAAHCPQCGLPTSDALKAILSSPEGNVSQSVADVPSQETGQVQPSPWQPEPRPDYRPAQQKKPNNLLLYILICVVVLLAIVIIAIFMHDRLGKPNEDFAPDSLTTIKELPADTLATPQPEVKKIQPVVEEPEFEEEEPEALPASSETEEIGAPTQPTQSTPQEEPAQPAQPVQQPAQ